ncbi:MAG: TrkH family potassium uptake protein [Halanaerobiales bacterium]
MKYISLLHNKYRMIIKYTGVIVMFIGVSIISPLLILLKYPSEWVYGKSFLVTSLFTLFLGYIFYIFGKQKKETTISLNEGGIIVLLSWIIAIFFSTIPFVWSLSMTWTQGIFEAVSGWTTTGLSVMEVEKTPNIFLLWRSIMQLLGGAGLAVIALSSILPMQGLKLYQAEGRTDKLLPHVRRSTKMIVQIYFGYTLAGIILYYISGMDLFNAVNHSFAALSTGGFSTVNASIGEWDNLQVELITVLLMLLGTINFATHFALIKGKVKIFFQNAEIKLMIFLISLSLPLISFFSLMGIYNNLGESFRTGFFQLTSAISTTGFSTIDFNNWPDFANFIIILLMIIGGGTGSTAGGIKQYRIYIIFKSIYWEIKHQFHPAHQIEENYVWRGEDRWYIKNEQIRDIANYIFIYLLTYVAGVTIFLIKGYPLKESLFEFASALGTVGLSIGITNAQTSGLILWTEIIGMVLGRLEILIIIFGFVKLFKDFNDFYQRR